MKQEELNFIHELGGVSAVAQECGISRSAVSQWKKKGIPRAQFNFLKERFPKQYEAARQTEGDRK